MTVSLPWTAFCAVSSISPTRPRPGYLAEHVSSADRGEPNLELHGDLVERLVHHLDRILEGHDVHPR